MKLFSSLTFLAITSILSSCEFHCNVGGPSSEDGGGKYKAVIKDGIKLYNGIDLTSHGLRINKAYLLFEDGNRVPDDNFIGEDSPVRLLVFIDSGWVLRDGKAQLGASEKITTEKGEELLFEEDLFRKKGQDFISQKDAGVIALTASLRLRKDAPPQSFNVSFRIWDKRGEGYVEGAYQLVSR